MNFGKILRRAVWRCVRYALRDDSEASRMLVASLRVDSAAATEKGTNLVPCPEGKQSLRCGQLKAILVIYAVERARARLLAMIFSKSGKCNKIRFYY